MTTTAAEVTDYYREREWR